MTQKKKYDLVCSLGSNCSACMQLSARGLRKISLPFDWVWYDSVFSMQKIAEGFKNNFSDFMKQENLRKLTEEEFSDSHPDRFQYEDLETKLRYYNHFYKTKNENAEIIRGISKFRKRCKRLDEVLKKINKVLFVITLNKEFSIQVIENLHSSIKSVYPNLDVYLHVVIFGASCNETVCVENITVSKYERKEHLYDYLKQPIEWDFLDDVELFDSIADKIKNHFISFKKTKKGCSFQIFKKIKSVFVFKIYLFGLRFLFSIGKDKL